MGGRRQKDLPSALRGGKVEDGSEGNEGERLKKIMEKIEAEAAARK
jgi:hypothetical protein